MQADLEKDMILKHRAPLGCNEDEDKHMTILKRLVDLRVVNGIDTITYEPDARHVDPVLTHHGLDKARGVGTSGEK